MSGDATGETRVDQQPVDPPRQPCGCPPIAHRQRHLHPGACAATEQRQLRCAPCGWYEGDPPCDVDCPRGAGGSQAVRRTRTRQRYRSGLGVELRRSHLGPSPCGDPYCQCPDPCESFGCRCPE